MLTAPDVVGLAEVLEVLEISRAAFDKTHRHRAGFPPARQLASGPVWERRAIVAYARQRKTGKPYLTVLTAWRDAGMFTYGNPGTGAVVDTIAKRVGVSGTTIRRYLLQLEEIPR